MWFFYSIAAAVLWGIDYSLTEKVLQKVRFSTLLSIELFFALIAMLIFSLVTNSFETDVITVLNSKQTFSFIALITGAFTVANMFIALSIENKSATLAGLIEISYPLFIALFSWKFFDESNINFGTAVGAICIFIGIALIYLFNQ